MLPVAPVLVSFCLMMSRLNGSSGCALSGLLASVGGTQPLSVIHAAKIATIYSNH